jgi:putative transposase
MLSYKFRIYPSKTTQRKLSEYMELCRWLYNHILGELNRAKAESRKITQRETQALIVKLKRSRS